jgi:hypothetical protein
LPIEVKVTLHHLPIPSRLDNLLFMQEVVYDDEPLQGKCACLYWWLGLNASLSYAQYKEPVALSCLYCQKSIHTTRPQGIRSRLPVRIEASAYHRAAAKLFKMHSFTALAIGLVIVAPSSARSTSGPYTDLEHRDTSTNTGNVMSWINRFFRRQAPESCVEDEYFNFAYNSTFGQSFCMAYMTYPNTTVTVTTTPIR